MKKQRKNRKKGKPHIKQRAFKDHNFSSIESHPREGKTLKSPYSKIPNVAFTSWKDQFLPNMLWAAVISVSLDRETYLVLFRKIVGASREIAQPDKMQLVHTYMSALEYDDFEKLLAPIREYPEAFSNLACLRLLDSLPDKNHWRRFTNEQLPNDAWTLLAHAIAVNFDHQSQSATDLRWLKVIHLIVSGRISCGPAHSDIMEEFRLYPTHGDMRKVRPSIRSMEMSVRSFELGPEKLLHAADLRSDEFWDECRKKTQCILIPKELPNEPRRSQLMDEITQLSIETADHFDTVPGTGIDPRKDAAFGLVLYTLALVMESAASRSHQLSGGRMMLRTMTEAFLTLHYLATKDDPSLWLQYRNYGVGQAKLSFLKLVREEELPKFVSLDELHDLANEDTWMEFQNIDLGSWQGKDLRKMAEDSGCKDVYDRYYSWTSGYSHGHWTSVRDAAFTTCFNSLHRFHRIPAPPRAMPSVLFDACKLTNRMLDDLNVLYPTFEARIKWHLPADPEAGQPPTESP